MGFECVNSMEIEIGGEVSAHTKPLHSTYNRIYLWVIGTVTIACNWLSKMQSNTIGTAATILRINQINQD